MPRKSAHNTIRITITTTTTVHEALGNLVKLGLYGRTIPEAAERIVCEGLRTDLKRRRAALVDPKQETTTER